MTIAKATRKRKNINSKEVCKSQAQKLFALVGSLEISATKVVKNKLESKAHLILSFFKIILLPLILLHQLE